VERYLLKALLFWELAIGRIKWQLINFLVGQAKLALLITRRNTIEKTHGQELLPVFKAFVKSRITIDFRYYKAMNDVVTFVQQWCYNDAVCTVEEGGLFFDILWC